MKSGVHDVFNQPAALTGYNLFTTDCALMDAVRRGEAIEWASQLASFGGTLGEEEWIRRGFQANEYPPVLETHDRFGRRRDEVEYHPAWHDLMRLSVANGLHNQPWSDPRPGSHVTRAALMMMAGENEAGHLCPLSMTYSSIPVLRLAPDLAAAWEPAVLSREYDPRFRPHGEKTGVLIGMGMTEKQGGSDVRANTTRAEPAGSGEYRITGHKWFCSAPMSDAFLVLAQAPGGLTCFLLPRWTPSGEKNSFELQRLKRKLGNRSNASSEVEFDRAAAWRIGEEGRGVATIIEMVQHTRLDCCIGSSAIVRRAVVEAIHHARQRCAFGKSLVDHSLMQAVLADVAAESEAATLLSMRLAQAFDRRASDVRERAFARLATTVAKYWICKRAPTTVAEALECLGGGGYVEESILPRLYREAPLNSIWEGSGNVICLDVLRVTRKEPECVAAVLGEIRLAQGARQHFDEAVNRLESMLAAEPDEASARHLTELMALLLQASLAVRFSTTAVADLLCDRLGAPVGRTFGALPHPSHARAVLDRAWPA
jgi:putative acyl-CoA dehydrogenase